MFAMSVQDPDLVAIDLSCFLQAYNSTATKQNIANNVLEYKKYKNVLVSLVFPNQVNVRMYNKCSSIQ